MVEIKISESAEQEYHAALGWYEEHSESAADRFALEFESALERIAEFPEFGPRCGAKLRSYLLKRFPYQII